MNRNTFDVLDAMARTPDAINRTVDYIATHMRLFMRPNERVLICFPKQESDSIGDIMEKAVYAVGGDPIFWGPDYRWKTLLKQAFMTRATTIIGTPLIILGLCKVAKATGTPLNIHNALLAIYPCFDWMIDGIRKGLDCRIWGCYVPGIGSVVGGFSCVHNRGVHLRTETYSFEIVGPNGNKVLSGEPGEIVISPNQDSFVRYYPGEKGRILSDKCKCGNPAPIFADIASGGDVDDALMQLTEHLHSWSSILDCKIVRGPCGLEMELITFPGEKLPKLPSCAKQIIRTWDPEKDIPFCVIPGGKKPLLMGKAIDN